MPTQYFPRIRVSERGAVAARVDAGGDAVEDVSELVTGLFRALQDRLGAAGAGDVEALRLDLAVPDPDACRDAEERVELIWREHFAGNVPVLAVHRAADGVPGLWMSGELPPRDRPAGPVCHGYSAADLEWQYGPILWEDGVQDTLTGWRRRGEAFLRGRDRRADLRYGPGPRETLDLYLPDGRPDAPLSIFVHGGYWQMMDKTDHCQFMEGVLDAGVAVAMLNYDLCPSVPLAEVGAQVRRAVGWLRDNASRYGYRDRGMQIIGHSAGGHLAAFAASRPPGDAPDPAIGSAVLISGLYDLAPLVHLPVARALGLNGPGGILDLSPVHLDPPPGLRTAVAVGEHESAEWHRQSATLAARWRARGAAVTEVEIPGVAHFGAVEDLVGGDLRALALDLL